MPSTTLRTLARNVCAQSASSTTSRSMARLLGHGPTLSKAATANAGVLLLLPGHLPRPRHSVAKRATRSHDADANGSLNISRPNSLHLVRCGTPSKQCCPPSIAPLLASLTARMKHQNLMFPSWPARVRLALWLPFVGHAPNLALMARWLSVSHHLPLISCTYPYTHT
jgi:hypothetical protein